MKIIECVQGSDEWFDAKLGKPGGSNFNRILCPASMKISKSREKYLWELAQERLDVRSESFKSYYMKRGSDLEPDARAHYEFIKSVTLREVGFCLDADGRYGISPDWLDDLSDAKAGGEAKCPSLETHMKYKDKNKLPTEYKLQVIGALAVTEYDYWDFMSYFPNTKEYIVRVAAEDCRQEINTLRIALEQFCDELDKLEKKARS